ncbi:MAG: glycosyltransferase family 2 protein [Haloplanus sp.]
MQSYSVAIPTLLRPEKLATCLDFLTRIPGKKAPEKVVVADDSTESRFVDDVEAYVERRDEIERTYADALNLEIVDLPADSGRNGKLNAGIERTDSPHLLLLDDDTYPPSNVYELVDVLESNPDLGGVAPFLEEDGKLQCNAGDYYAKRGWMLKDSRGPKTPESTGTGSLMFRYDQIPPIGMFRRELFDEYTWDDEYVVGMADTDFFLKHNELDSWTFAVTPNYVVRHDPGPGTIDVYFDERRNLRQMNESARRLTEKFDIEGFFQVGGHLEPRRPFRDRVTRWVGLHLVPNRVLWWLKRTTLGHRIQKAALSSYQ